MSKKRIPRNACSSALERAVARWANSHGTDYENGAEGALADLLYGGCQSGMVSGLIYYRDTVSFYRRHKREIAELLGELVSDVCEKDAGPAALFGEKWDAEDPLASDTLNQNLLAWFGFEESARRLVDRLGWDCDR